MHSEAKVTELLSPPQSTHKHYECTSEIEEVTPLDNHRQKCRGGKLHYH